MYTWPGAFFFTLQTYISRWSYVRRVLIPTDTGPVGLKIFPFTTDSCLIQSFENFSFSLFTRTFVKINFCGQDLSTIFKVSKFSIPPPTPIIMGLLQGQKPLWAETFAFFAFFGQFGESLCLWKFYIIKTRMFFHPKSKII